jgi:hypothetical protein
MCCENAKLDFISKFGEALLQFAMYFNGCENAQNPVISFQILRVFRVPNISAVLCSGTFLMNLQFQIFILFRDSRDQLFSIETYFTIFVYLCISIIFNSFHFQDLFAFLIMYYTLFKICIILCNLYPFSTL